MINARVKAMTGEFSTMYEEMFSAGQGPARLIQPRTMNGKLVAACIFIVSFSV
jgi:hypothetical protein